MKNLFKLLVLLISVFTLVFNLNFDSSGALSISKANASSSYESLTTGETGVKWKKEFVYCLDYLGNVWGYRYGCFKGEEATCEPTDCEPFPTAPPTNIF